MAHVLLVGTTDGETWMFKIPSGDVKTFQSHGEASTTGKIMPDGLCGLSVDLILLVWLNHSF